MGRAWYAKKKKTQCSLTQTVNSIGSESIGPIFDYVKIPKKFNRIIFCAKKTMLPFENKPKFSRAAGSPGVDTKVLKNVGFTVS